jgi:hypothetical protein
MTGTRTALGTVVQWDEERRGGLIETADVDGQCWADESVVVQGTESGGGLRAGQIVEFDWVESADVGLPRHATRVVARDDLQGGFGG